MPAVTVGLPYESVAFAHNAERQVARLLVPVVVIGVALTGCGRSGRNSDDVVPVATTATASTVPAEVGTGTTTGAGDTTLPASTAPVVVTVDPEVEQALAELEELTRQIEADLKAGNAAAANGG